MNPADYIAAVRASAVRLGYDQMPDSEVIDMALFALRVNNVDAEKPLFAALVAEITRRLENREQV